MGKHFVLVHGAGHGAWCWYKVRCRLEQLGHTVTCVDLGSSGIDLHRSDEIRSFQDYNRPLSDFMAALTPGAKVVLVGHSAGGLNVTSVLHEFPEKVAASVYVSANMLRNGFCTPQDVKVAVPDMSNLGDEAENLYSPDGFLKPEYQRMLLYNLSPPEDATLASMLLRPAPKVFTSARFEETEAVDKVRRLYVKDLQDNMLKPYQQELMIQMWPPAQVFTLESDHSPFFSFPSELCDLLLQA